MKHRNLDSLDDGNKIRQSLAKIRRYYEPALTGPKAVDESGVRGVASPEPVTLDVLEARRDVLHDLHFWCKFILDEVNDGTITRGPEPTVTSMTEFIGRWCDLLLEQHPADGANLIDETGHHARKLESLAKGWRTKRVQIGKCPEQHLHADEHGREWFEPCRGELWAIVREQDALLPPKIRCDVDEGHEWGAWQFPNLGKRLGAPIKDLIA